MPRTAHGPVMPFRHELEVSVARDVTVPLCAVCGEMRLSEADAERLIEALEEAYKAQRLKQQRDEVTRV